MARLARVVLPGVPHLVTQRGNRREPVFFCDADYNLYRTLLAAAVARAKAEVWAYCLMPNHVHIIIVPSDTDGLRRSFADCHRRYTATINARNGWTGHLWQGRFGSVAMDEPHLLAALRYVSLNPVRAGLVRRAEDWPWSSTRAYTGGQDDCLIRSEPGPKRIELSTALSETLVDEQAAFDALRQGERIGRPVGSRQWITEAEEKCARRLAAGRRGPKAKTDPMRETIKECA